MKTLCRSLSTILILLMSCGVFAIEDSSVDSLRQVWNDPEQHLDERFKAMKAFYRQFLQLRPNESQRLLKQHYQLAQQAERDWEAIYAGNKLAQVYFIKGAIDSSFMQLKTSLIDAEQVSDTVFMGRIQNNLGLMERMRGNYENAVWHHKECLKLRNRRDSLNQFEIEDLAGYHINISTIYNEVGAIELSRNYLDSARALYEQLEKPGRDGLLWMLYGNNSIDEKDHDQAIKYYWKSMESCRQSGDTRSLEFVYYNLSLIHSERGRTDSAIYYAEEAIALSTIHQNVDEVVKSNILLHGLLDSTEVQAKADLVQSIESGLSSMSGTTYFSEAYAFLSEVYKRRGDAEKALAMQDLHLAYADSARNEEGKLAVIRQSMEEKHQSELRALENNAVKLKTDLVSKQRQRLAWTLMLAGLLFGGLVWYMRKKSRASIAERNHLLAELEELRTSNHSEQGSIQAEIKDVFHIDRQKIEAAIERELNETDWKVLEILAEDPVISNKDIGEKAFVSVDGIGSALRRMYVYFEVKESKYKKISLLLEAVKLSRA